MYWENYLKTSRCDTCNYKTCLMKLKQRDRFDSPGQFICLEKFTYACSNNILYYHWQV